MSVSRLTIKNENVDFLTGVKFEYETDDLYAIDKLGKLEDIEAELGIDLLTLFKALKDGIYTENSGAYGEDLKFRYFIGTPSLEYEHRYQKIPMVTSVRTKDFNKTWWIDKPKENDDD